MAAVLERQTSRDDKGDIQTEGERKRNNPRPGPFRFQKRKTLGRNLWWNLLRLGLLLHQSKIRASIQQRLAVCQRQYLSRQRPQRDEHGTVAQEASQRFYSAPLPVLEADDIVDGSPPSFQGRRWNITL